MSPVLRGRLSLCIIFITVFIPLTAESAGRLSFPPEWSPQEAVWLEWIETPGPQSLQAEMISAMAPHVRIRLLVESDSVRTLAEDSLGARGVDLDRVEFFMNDLPSFWVRDPGPRFLSDGRNLAIAELGWNHYGYPESMIMDDMQDGTLDEEIAARLGLPLVSTPVVAEGGAIEASTSCLLSYADVAQARNPGLSLEEIEAEYLRVYGKDRMIWLDRCPPSDLVKEGAMVDDYYGFGANGHIDEFVRFVNDSTLVIAQVDSIESLSDPVSRADFLVLRENLAQLRTVRRPDGRPFNIVTLPVPALEYYTWTFELDERHR
ncbi:MAG TPA: agmatine deiminase family protein, partial [Candidatus Krumholzibacterium sp.]|nr:agmatine deiminase family protein [Candidatus Krumholzibacterium sp.]